MSMFRNRGQPPLSPSAPVSTWVGVATDVKNATMELRNDLDSVWASHRKFAVCISFVLAYWILFCGIWAEGKIPDLETKCYRTNLNCSWMGPSGERLCGPNDDIIAITSEISNGAAPYYLILYAIPVWLLLGPMLFVNIWTSFQTWSAHPSFRQTKDLVNDIAIKHSMIIFWTIGFTMAIVKWAECGLSDFPWWAISVFPAFSLFTTGGSIIFSLLTERTNTPVSARAYSNAAPLISTNTPSTSY